MYGLCLINQHFTSDGTGRDFVVLADKERRNGKIGGPGPYRTACLNRECHPRKRHTGPRPPSVERVKQLNQGLWQCTGQWSPKAKSSKALPHDPEKAFESIERRRNMTRSMSDTSLAKACNGNYEETMQTWVDARRERGLLPRSAGSHQNWSRCHSQSISPRGGERPLGPDLAEPSFERQTMAQTASATFGLDTRKAHGYLEPGILRRPGSFSKRPASFVGVNVERGMRDHSQDRFLSTRQGHEIEVGRSTVREPRFIPATVGHSVDVRRSN